MEGPNDERPYDAQSGPPTARRRTVLARVAVALLAVCCALLAGSLWYTNESAQQWRERATATEQARAKVQGELDQSQAAVAQLESDLTKTKASLASMTTDYNEASARIRSLANEKAQVGDSLAQVQQLTTLSRQVSTRLDSCINDLRQLQAYIVSLEQYNVYDVVAFARSVNDSCDEAQSLNASLAAMIDQL